jgi:hypothetical protein
MKRKLIAIAALTVFIAGCTKTDGPLKTDALQKTEAYNLSQPAEKKPAPAPINFTAPFLFPEGMVYNPFNDQFLVSSLTMDTIGAVNKQGIYSPFIEDNDLVSTAGMEIDKARKRLLVTNSKVEGDLAQLAIYDLTTKARLFLVDLVAVAHDGAPHLANDVALDQQGNAYVTDSYAGIIYKVNQNGNATVFYRNPAYTPAPGGFGFNGIEYSNSNQGYLLVAHSAQNKILKMPINNPASLTTVQLTPSIVSPDGLLLSKNSKELIIVNNTAQFPGSKVMSFETNNNWATAASTEEFATGIVYPTTVTSDGKTEWVLYSYIHLLFGNVYRETFTIQPLPFTGNNPF